MLDEAEAFGRIKQTSFRYRQEIMDQFLDETFRREQGLSRVRIRYSISRVMLTGTLFGAKHIRSLQA